MTTAMFLSGLVQRPCFVPLARCLPWCLLAISTGAQASKALSLEGTLGLHYEDYDYAASGTDLQRTHWEKSMDLSARGFIWDPRFLSYGASITLLDSDVDSSGADSGQDYVGYQLSTTWFGHRKHPFNLYAQRSADTVSNEEVPSYTLDTQTLGMRWGMDNQLLGTLNFSYDTQQASTDNALAARDEESQQVSVEGRRGFQKEPASVEQSDLTYGYRYNESTEQISQTEHRQHYLYAYERSVLSEKTHLSLNTSYYEREDSWQDPLNLNAPPDPIASSFFSLNSTLTHNSSKSFAHHYNLALSRNAFESSDTDSYTVTGGFNAIVNPQWTAHGSLGIKNTLIRHETADNTETMDGTLQSGMRYQQALGTYHLNGSYNFAFYVPMVSTAETDNGVQSTHTAGLGYSRYTNPRYQDALNYRINLIEGRDESREQNTRYAVTSLLANGDSLQASIDYRDFNQTAIDSWSKRLDLSWNHRFNSYNTLNLSAGWSESGGETSHTRRDHLQLRTRWTPRRLRRLIISALARAESEHTEGTSALSTATLETDASYSFGLWETQARYRYRDQQGGLRDLREQSIILTLKRRLPGLL